MSDNLVRNSGVFFLQASEANEQPDPVPDPDMTTSVCEDMEAAEDAEQGLAARGRKRRAAKIRVRRKK